MMDPVCPLRPRGTPEGQACRGQGDGWGPGILSTGAPVWPAPGRVQSLGLHCAGRGRRRPQRQGCESTQREWSVVEAAGPPGLCSHRGTLPFPSWEAAEKGAGSHPNPPHPRLHLCSGVLQQVLRVLSIPQRCPRDTGHQEPREPNSLACPALPTEPRTWPWQEAGDGGTWRGTGQRCAHRRTGHGVLTASQF